MVNNIKVTLIKTIQGNECTKNIVSFRYPLCYAIAQLLIIEPNNNLIDNAVLLSKIWNNQQGRINSEISKTVFIRKNDLLLPV